MLFVNKLKVLTLMACLVLVGQVFAEWDGESMTQATPQKIDNVDYYIIDSEEKLAWFANESNKNHTGAFSKNAKLMKDLDMGSHLWIPICAGAGGTGINKVTYCKYGGIFDGNGHTISNLKMVSSELEDIDSLYVQNVGFIGAFTGTLQGLTLENVIVLGQGNGGRYVQQSTSNNAYSKPVSIGTLVGWSSGTVQNCRAIGEIVTSGVGQSVGGLVGNSMGGSITGSISEVSVDASGVAYAGGIVGYTKNTVTISSCVYAGSGVHAEGSGEINGKTYVSQAGAVVGNAFEGSSVTLTDVYYDNTGVENVSGRNGKQVKGDVTGLSDLNNEEVVCILNGGTWDENELKCVNANSSDWSVGVSKLSFRGSDGYKITFDANGGEFPIGAKTSKGVALNAPISAEEITTPLPLGDEVAFAGWATSADASEPDEDLGTVTGPTTIYAVWKLINVYTITFDANQGTFPDGETTKEVRVVEGGKISEEGFAVPEKITIDNKTYFFTGWALTQKDLLPAEAIPDTVHLADLTVDEEKTIYAVWTAAQIVTVTFNPNGHGTTLIDYVNVDKGQPTNKPVDPTPNNGYSFLRWCETSTPCETEFNFGSPIQNNITLYASWNPLSYDITYNLNGVETTHNNPLKYTVESSFTFKEPALTEGKEFKGWFYDDNLSDPAKSISAGTTGDKTVYAKWSIASYKVTYRAGNNGTGEVLPVTTQYGESVVLEGKSYTREGYVQDGWSRTDGGSKAFDFGENYVVRANTELYPHWVLAYTITYLPGADEGISGEIEAGTKVIDVPFELSSETFTREGYTQDGWMTTEDGNAVEYALGATYTDNAALTLYPHWVAVYTITYAPGEDAGVTGEVAVGTKTEGEDATLSNIGFTREGYTQTGWKTENGSVTYDMGATYTTDASVTLYPIWEAEVYHVYYHNIEGATFETSNPETYTIEDIFPIALNSPSKTGFNFLGWFLSEDDAEPVDGIAAGSIGEANFYAKWSNPIEYTATYVLAGGSMEGNTSFTFTIVSGELPLATPTKDGYSFVGWLDNVTSDVETALPAGSFGNRTLMAQWSLLPIKVTASSGTFEYDGETHNATCSYEGTLPDGYSIEMEPSGSVQKVSDGIVPTSCTVVIKDESDNVVTDQFTKLTIVDGTISVVAKAVPYGAVTIYTDETGNRAVIDGEYTGEGVIEINDNIEVKEITFNREFATGSQVYSTIMFPFSIAKEKVIGGKFFGLKDVDENYKVSLTSKFGDVLEANTPYIVEATADRLTFDLKGDDKVVFNTTVKNAKKSSNGIWELLGTYEFRTWKADDYDIGRVYGFAAKTSDDPNSIGQFRMGRVGTIIKPMRAYLLYTPAKSKARALAKSLVMKASVLQAEAPDELNVVIDDDDGETTVIGKLNPATGEITIINNWYDMKGRRLNAKPTTRGIYYFNGKRVIVR